MSGVLSRMNYLVERWISKGQKCSHSTVAKRTGMFSIKQSEKKHFVSHKQKKQERVVSRSGCVSTRQPAFPLGL